MPVIAQSADGVQHSFPDGTNPAVIDKVMKQYATSAPAPPQNSEPAPPNGIMGRIKNAVIAPESERDKTFMGALREGVMGVPAEIGKQFMENVTNLGHDLVPQDMEQFNRANSLPFVAVPALDAAGAIMSPITGALTSIVGRPLEQATGVRREIGGDVASAFVPLGGVSKLGKAQKIASGIHPMATEARTAGYVLPPRMISKKPGLVANVLSGWSGKVKTAQEASAKNQEITNSLAAKALNLPEDAQLAPATFKGIRAEAGKAYSAIPKALSHVAVDDDFLTAVSSLGGSNGAAAKAFPNITKNQDIINLVDELGSVKNYPTEAGLEIVKELRSSAAKNLKNHLDPSKTALGKAQRQAADAVDDLIERNLAQVGDEGLVTQYRDARKTIAKSYAVEAATNSATGNVDARKIAAMGSRGKPLTGELDTIAKVAGAFPKAFQSEATFGAVEPLSVLDMGAAAMTAVHGNPSVAAAILGRPLVRKAILSEPYQNVLSRAGEAASARTVKLPRRAPTVNALYQLSQQHN